MFLFIFFHLHDIQCLRVFGVAYYVFKHKIHKFKMANLIWWIKIQNLLVLHETRFSSIYGITDCESEYNIWKFRMADPIWRTKMQKSYLFWMKLDRCGFLESLIVDLKTKFRLSKWLIQYGETYVKICSIRIKIGTRGF